MHEFIQKYREKATAVLSGFDRIVFRGLLRSLAFLDGMKRHLSQKDVPRRDFAKHVEQTTKSLIEASLSEARQTERPIVYLPSSKTRKEQVAKEILIDKPVDSGLVCVIKCVEPCMSYEMHRNHEIKQLELVYRLRKCLHLYHYYLDPAFGLMNARIQTWYPFHIQVCVNGRQWLARRMDENECSYSQYDNSFIYLEDPEQAQCLLDELPRINWTETLDQFARWLNPAHDQLVSPYAKYYWTAHQTEWATDVLFASPQALQDIYPQLVWGAITAFSSRDVLRFLGKRLQVHCTGEVTSRYQERPEGMSIKHTVNNNSIKMYDKGGRILRIETTINNPHDLNVLRPKEGGPSDQIAPRMLRKGVADIERRANLSQRANERYLDALSHLDTDTPLAQIFAPVTKRVKRNKTAYRALRLWESQDLEILAAINRPEFLLPGFRNKDISALLYPKDQSTLPRRRAASARVSYRLRLLRAHGLIAKISSTRRYRITPKGSQIAAAILMAQHATLQQLNAKAA